MQAQVKQRALPGNESVLRLIWQEPLGRAGLLGVTLIVILAVLAPLISPFDVAKMHPQIEAGSPFVCLSVRNGSFWTRCFQPHHPRGQGIPGRGDCFGQHFRGIWLYFRHDCRFF